MKMVVLSVVVLLAFLAHAYADSERFDFCHSWNSYEPEANQAAYQPGVSVDGTPVVPADVQPHRHYMLPDVVRTTISADFARYLEARDIEGLMLEAPLGEVAFDHQARTVTYNGINISNALAGYCEEILNPNIEEGIPQEDIEAETSLKETVEEIANDTAGTNEATE